MHSRELKLPDEEAGNRFYTFKLFIWYKVSIIFSVDVEL